MFISKIWLRLSIIAGILMAIVSATGVFYSGVYSQEHASWAAQGFGQDIVNLFIVFPILLLSSYFAKKGLAKAILLWLGVVIYMTYSYVLYAFFMHFGSWFLVYVAVLGLSFYTMVGSIIELIKQVPPELSTKTKGPSIYLLVNGLMFGVLWFIEIIPATLNAQVPKSATEVGLPLNPVHVLDLGFLLPAMIATAALLWRKKPMGQLLTVPLITFAVLMASAIISMIASMNTRGILEGVGAAPIMLANTVFGLFFLYRFFKGIKTVQA
jgi:hypothetical protein